jgi:hypothetical protein
MHISIKKHCQLVLRIIDFFQPFVDIKIGDGVPHAGNDQKNILTRYKKAIIEIDFDPVAAEVQPDPALQQPVVRPIGDNDAVLARAITRQSVLLTDLLICRSTKPPSTTACPAKGL